MDQINIIPVSKPISINFKDYQDDQLLGHCKALYKHFKLIFIPMLFWINISERNLVKAFAKLTLFRNLNAPLL